MARKPSHFGSYCQEPASPGSEATALASVGAMGGWKGSRIRGGRGASVSAGGVMVRACYPGGSLVGPEVRCSAPFRTRVHCIRRCGRLAAFDPTGACVEEQIGKTVWQGRI